MLASRIQGGKRPSGSGVGGWALAKVHLPEWRGLKARAALAVLWTKRLGGPQLKSWRFLRTLTAFFFLSVLQ